MTSDSELRVRAKILEMGPLLAFRVLLVENDKIIREANLGGGLSIASSRAAVYTELVRHWAATQHQALGYDKPFAVVALGATGRAEITPFSDHDFAFLFEDAIDGNLFLRELQEQVIQTDRFEVQYGFSYRPLPFNLDDVAHLSGKQLNSFLDMRPVYDPGNLSERFRERIRGTFDPFEHFLHVRSFWKGQWEKAAGEFERLDRFDIKNDGLRVFLAGVWTLAGKRFVHSHEVYQALDDSRDLEAYGLLLRVRAFIHSQRRIAGQSEPKGNHAEDILGFEDFTSFGQWLGPEVDDHSRFLFATEVRARVIAARRRVAQFTKGVIERELKQGREIGPDRGLVYGVGGLRYAASPAGNKTPKQQSSAALALVLASQRYAVPIDPAELTTTFRNAGDWLARVPELSALFYEPRGSLADSFAFLSQFEGAEERLFPGYARFEASLDGRVMAEGISLRSALERRKIGILEEYVRQGRQMLSTAISSEHVTDLYHGVSIPVEAALLDAEHLAAVKLALKTKRLPLTPDDVRHRQDESLPLHERFSTGLSDIPVEDYYKPYISECDFTPETIRVTQFLIANRRAFKERGKAPINDAHQVQEFAGLCQDEHLLRSLFVFTAADRAEWESEKEDPARWFSSRELYRKTMIRFKPGLDPTRSLETAGYSPEQLHILKDFGVDFFTGVYREYANRFGSHLVRLIEVRNSAGPKVNIMRDGASTIIGVAALDYRGLAATISGALWSQGINIALAHFFSATNHGLVLDFFHVLPGAKPPGSECARFVEAAIRGRSFIGDSDEANLPMITGRRSLQEWRPGQYCLHLESPQDKPGLIYTLTYKIFRHLRGNIFGLSSQSVRGRVFLSIYHSLPPDISLERARILVNEKF
jgi:hypothetical protein